ncbi:MAG: RHS repeat-associated core domain-containing protein, partial [Spirochaetales bacterium]|nr:RHS repeat-associated core domain-containing protein [Spirochaetales bacterium]
FEKTLERLKEVGHNGHSSMEALTEYHYGYGEILSLQDVREDFSGAWRGQRERTNLFQDVLGSTVYATHKNHGEAFSYDAFGRGYEGNLEFAGDIGYNGKRMDPVTEFYDYGFRHYLSQNKRWMTVDPIRSGLNWYVYCSNDPINFIDLFGLLESDIQAAHGVKIDPYNPSGDAYQPGPVPEEIEVGRLINQKARGYFNLVLATAEVAGSFIVAGFGILAGDDTTLPAIAGGLFVLGSRNIGFAVHDIVSANSGRIIENPTGGPLPDFMSGYINPDEFK